MARPAYYRGPAVKRSRDTELLLLSMATRALAATERQEKA
jgi:hypothetical protein